MCALLPNGALRAGASTPENIRGNPRCTTARPRVSNHAVERFQQRVDSTCSAEEARPATSSSNTAFCALSSPSSSEPATLHNFAPHPPNPCDPLNAYERKACQRATQPRLAHQRANHLSDARRPPPAPRGGIPRRPKHPQTRPPHTLPYCAVRAG